MNDEMALLLKQVAADRAELMRERKRRHEAERQLDAAIFALAKVREWALDYRHDDGSFEEDKDEPFLLAHNAICDIRGHTP